MSKSFLLNQKVPGKNCFGIGFSDLRPTFIRFLFYLLLEKKTIKNRSNLFKVAKSFLDDLLSEKCVLNGLFDEGGSSGRTSEFLILKYRVRILLEADIFPFRIMQLSLFSS